MTPDELTHLAAVIDHTLLKPDATRGDIDRLCAEAVQFGFATVCINPTWVPHAAHALTGSRVGVCTVVAFPVGAIDGSLKAHLARSAISDGAHEIDMPINVGLLKSGGVAAVAGEIRELVEASRESPVRIVTKIIIECGLLTEAEKVSACTLALAAGADFVKTSTGFGWGGATVADVTLIRRVVGDGMGIKAAGGIRDLATAKALLAAGATRIGTSAGVTIFEEARRQETA
jgi:deoxyribose-phosphate aldolase